MKAQLSKLILAVLVLGFLKAAATTRYVDLNSPSPTPPYTSWPTAATNIQDAIDVASAGDLILVTNGVYQTGGRLATGATTNRVAVTKAVTVRSVNGPLDTIIQGYQVPGTLTGSSAVRCVYLANEAVLNGFTLTNGATGNGGGGGVESESLSAIVTNCVIVGNIAHLGGGTYSGTLDNCTLSNNTAIYGGGAYSSVTSGCLISSNFGDIGGGAYFSTLINCVVTGNSFTVMGSRGGGVHSSTLTNCVISGNSASGGGGGAYGGTLNNCILTNNWSVSGGGAYFSTLNSCILVGNSSSLDGAGARSGQLYNCTVVGNWTTNLGGGTAQTANYNCIVYSNSAPQGADGYQSTFNYCWTNDPGFVNFATGDFRLQSNSPCINAGKNSYVTNFADFDGDTRIIGGTVDIGAHEFQSPSSVLSYAWAQQYGFPTDGSADFTDPDNDGMNNWGEFRSDTIPTNTLSVLRIINVTNTPSGAVVTWESVSTRRYSLERATNLGSPSSFQFVATNISGVNGTKTYPDLRATNAGPYFYRVGVQ